MVAGIALSKDEKPASEFYTVDRRGNLQNLQYGSLSQYDIPRYRTIGHGRVLGLDSRFRVSRDTNQVEEIQADPGARSRHGYQSLLSMGPYEEQLALRVDIETGEDAVKLQKDFVPIGGVKRRRRDDSHQVGDLQEDTKSDTEPSSTSSEDEIEEQNAYDAFRNDKAHQRLVELECSARDHPENVATWLELATHQHSVGASRISIYERALASVKSPNGRERLFLELLGEGKSLWDTTKLFAKWESVLKETGTHNFDLWLKYLDLQQTTFSRFTVDGCLTLYIQCLEHAKVLQDSVKRDKTCIYLLLRCTIFLRQAGFVERAIAIWQALMEWIFFAPEKGFSTDQDELRAFEKWWDSEVARIGDEGAQGWRSNDTADMPPRSDPHFESDFIAEGKFHTWASREEYYARNSKLPARALDDIKSDDLFRVVIFSDIREFLFRPEKTEGRRLLIDAFLIFCDLPPLSDQARKWWTDPFLRVVSLNIDDEAGGMLQPKLNFVSPTSNFGLDSQTLFSDPREWFSSWSKSSFSDLPWIAVDSVWCHRSLRQLVEEVFYYHDSIAEYVVAFELSTDPPAARKYAKALLKRHTNSLKLYNAFAQVQCRLGNYDDAEKVWATALSMNQSFGVNQQKDSIILWRTWVWETMERRDYDRCMRLILSIPDGHFNLNSGISIPPSSPLGSGTALPASMTASTSRLRAQRYLESRASSQLSLQRNETVIHFIDLLAILTYLTTNRSLSAAYDIYQQALVSIARDTEKLSGLMRIELLHQSMARLVHFHTTTSSPLTYRPIEISQILRDSLQHFPENTIFLSLHGYHTRQTHLIDRLRSVSTLQPAMTKPSQSQVIPGSDCQFQSQEFTKSSLTSSTFSIAIELMRPAYGGRTEHSVRAAFMRALNDDSSSSHVSPSLWLNYLRWELSLPNPLKSNWKSTSSSKIHKRLRDLFYQALRSCPYSRPLYMVAFASQVLRYAIGDDGLQEIYDTMVEKGLRLHHELR
jgi:tetratricopeptide (TPR) repeat protein